MTILYWCEFPEKCDWKKLASWIKEEKIIIYVTCRSREDYEQKKKKIQNVSKNIEVNAWPILSKEEGYWFSAFTNKRSIDTLEQYRGLKIKIDIEPPIPKTYTLKNAFTWVIINIFKKAKNKKYFQEKIISLSKDTEIILSTFPLPKWILKRWGWIEDPKIKYNYMYYSTFIPSGLKWLYKHYYKWHFKTNKEDYIALGLIGPGIFKKEPIYKDIKEMKEDIHFLKNRKEIGRAHV